MLPFENNGYVNRPAGVKDGKPFPARRFRIFWMSNEPMYVGGCSGMSKIKIEKGIKIKVPPTKDAKNKLKESLKAIRRDARTARNGDE